MGWGAIRKMQPTMGKICPLAGSAGLSVPMVDLTRTHMPLLMDNNALLRCGQPSNSSSKIDISIAKTRGWIVGGGRLVVMVVCQVEVFPFLLGRRESRIPYPVPRQAPFLLPPRGFASPWRTLERKIFKREPRVRARQQESELRCHGGWARGRTRRGPAQRRLRGGWAGHVPVP